VPVSGITDGFEHAFAGVHRSFEAGESLAGGGVEVRTVDRQGQQAGQQG
jgi:hypothetical protein